MIIGENPWLLSQVHYIMPASQSASRPPLTLSSVTAGRISSSLSPFFPFFLQILTMSSAHTRNHTHTHTHTHTANAQVTSTVIHPPQEPPTPPHTTTTTIIVMSPELMWRGQKKKNNHLEPCRSQGNVGHRRTSGNSVCVCVRVCILTIPSFTISGGLWLGSGSMTTAVSSSLRAITMKRTAPLGGFFFFFFSGAEAEAAAAPSRIRSVKVRPVPAAVHCPGKPKSRSGVAWISRVG